MEKNSRLDERHRQVIKDACEGAFKEFSRTEEFDSDTRNAHDKDLWHALKTNRGPDYKDPNIVASYLKCYNLSHCAMTYQIFYAVLKSATPKNIYVCDVGAGIAAGLTGILLALEHRVNSVQIYFDAVESSEAMRKAATLFVDRLELSKKESIVQMRSIPVMDSSFGIPDLPKDTIKIVSAFHLSWPYKVNLLKKTEEGSVYWTLHQALNQIRPHHGLFTSNKNKMEVLKKVVSQCCDSPRFKVEAFGIPSVNSAPFHSPSGAKCLWYRTE